MLVVNEHAADYLLDLMRRIEQVLEEDMCFRLFREREEFVLALSTEETSDDSFRSGRSTLLVWDPDDLDLDQECVLTLEEDFEDEPTLLVQMKLTKAGMDEIAVEFDGGLHQLLLQAPNQ
jgi:hypothetical protein